MDEQTLKQLRRFKKRYNIQPSMRVLEVGSRSEVNGGVRHLFYRHSLYHGIDIQPGEGVDEVVTKTWHLRTQFDLVLSVNTLEHITDPQNSFWMMSRHVARYGYLYIQAPFAHVYHRHPVDCFRYAPDGLTHWAGMYGLHVEECYLVYCTLLNNIPTGSGRRLLQHLHGVLLTWRDILRGRYIPGVNCVLIARKL